LGKTTSQTSNRRPGDYLAVWARIINKTSLNKAGASLDKAHRTNHNKAARLVRVRNKAEGSSVDLAKTTNKINSSKLEVYSAGWANKIQHNKLGVYLVV
jgi:hypothetical protein